MTAIPFDVERAKRIQAGEEPGKIVTRGGRNVRIVCWDRKTEQKYKIVSLSDTGKFERVLLHDKTGESDSSTGDNLVLQVPEWTQFKDGDVIYCDTTDYREDRYIWIAVMKELYCQDSDRIHIDFYFSIDIEGECKGETVFDELDCCADYVRLATEEEKQKLIDALKQSTDPRAKEYLKRFFGIEEKEEYKFKPKDWVLCYGDGWNLCQFSHTKLRDIDYAMMYVTVGGIAYERCIPYNEKTKHLLGTTNNWKE